jgi:pimeloyl-ACP methyl ester carboxylesterase
MEAAVTEFLDLPGGRIAYDVTGEGPLLVCVPGMGDIRGAFRLLIPRLAEAGYRVAAESPAGVAGIVLLSTARGAPKLNPLQARIFKLVVRSPALWTRYVRSLYPGTKPADLDAYLFLAVTPMAAPNPIDAMTQAPRVRCPALIIMGTRDRDVPDAKAEAEAVAATLGGPAEVVMVQDAGHYLHAQFPTQTAAAVRDFHETTIRA